MEKRANIFLKRALMLLVSCQLPSASSRIFQRVSDSKGSRHYRIEHTTFGRIYIIYPVFVRNMLLTFIQSFQRKERSNITIPSTLWNPAAKLGFMQLFLISLLSFPCWANPILLFFIDFIDITPFSIKMMMPFMDNAIILWLIIIESSFYNPPLFLSCSFLCWLQLFPDSNCETMLGAEKGCVIHELRQILVNLKKKSEPPWPQS